MRYTCRIKDIFKKKCRVSSFFIIIFQCCYKAKPPENKHLIKNNIYNQIRIIIEEHIIKNSFKNQHRK